VASETKADPAIPRKEATNSMLKTSIGLAKADAELLEDARDEQLLGEDPPSVPTRDGQVPDFREQVHHGLA
jgi:hypothetical protein